MLKVIRNIENIFYTLLLVQPFLLELYNLPFRLIILKGVYLIRLSIYYIYYIYNAIN
jgi:hypothetical protein